MKAKRILGLVLAGAMIMAGCGGSSSASSSAEAEAASSAASEAAVSEAEEESTSEATEEESTSEETAAESEAAEEPLVLEYMTTSMSVEWMQQIVAALEEIAAEENCQILTADANRDIDTQLSQIDTAITQQIDGAFLFIVDEGSATAAVDKFNEAGIPVIGETLKLQDGDGNNIAPYVELDAAACGEKCGQWVVENWESTGVDLSDVSTVGVIQDTNSKYRSDLVRVDGFMSGIEALGIPESNVFMADCAAEATSNDNTEASYNQVSAILAAHPEIKAWLVFGSVDSYAMGAARAIEAAGQEANTILTSSGGELAVKEWTNGAAPEWRATCYYGAMDFAKQMMEGMLGVIRDGKSLEEIYPEFKQDGQTYSAVEISGTMVTSENYQDYVE